MSKCLGCGVTLQDSDSNLLGYTNNIEKGYCLRCFRIKNYNDYKLVSKTNNDYIPIIKKINETNSLVVLVVDLFNIGNLDFISKYLNNKILLVLTKRDLIPLSVYDKRLEEYFGKLKLNIIDKVIISSKNNYNYDLLYSKINKYKTDDVYVVGFTNAGKSSMINKILYNYTDNSSNITTSYLPSTTLDSIEIDLGDFKLIDTPGILEEGNIINYIDKNVLKKIIPNKEIKPKVFQIKSKQSIIVDDLLKIDIKDNNNIIFYMSNNLKYQRIYKDNDKLENLERHEISVKDNMDIVISGLGFIKIKKATSLVIYTIKNVDVYTRKSLI